MMRILVLALALGATACVKEKKTSEYKTSELIAHFDWTPSGATIICGAYFTLKDDPATQVTLEDDALVVCNETPLTRSGALFSGGIAYSPGLTVTTSLIRRIDGSTLSQSYYVY